MKTFKCINYSSSQGLHDYSLRFRLIEMFLSCMWSWEIFHFCIYFYCTSFHKKGNRKMTQSRKMNWLISSTYLEISQVKMSRSCISLWATGDNDWDRTTALTSRPWDLRWHPHEHLAQNNCVCQMAPWWSVEIARPSIWHLHLCRDTTQLP